MIRTTLPRIKPGFLLNPFTAPLTNDRTDGYDGSFENHIRLPLEIAHDGGIWPKDKPHGAAFSKKAIMFSVGADGKLLGQAIHNLFDGPDTDGCIKYCSVFQAA